MNKPKISVICTTYNRPERLKKAIKSVINQSFKDWELIVVDDASPDKETKEVVKSFKDDRIVYHKRKENFGNHAQPKNDGLTLARANLIAYLDDDNEYKKDHLQVLYNEIRKNPEVDLVFGERDIIVDEKTPNNKKLPPTKGMCLQSIVDSINMQNPMGLIIDMVSQNMMMSFMIQRNYIDTSDVLHRKNILFEIGGWNEKQPKFGDWNLWCRLLKAGYKFKYVPLSITNYHYHKECKSFTVKSKVIQRNDGTFFDPTWFDPVDCDIELPFLKIAEEPKIAVFTITWNRLDYTKKMVKSMKECCKKPYDHYFIDNGSDDGTKEYLEGLLKTKTQYKAIKDIIFNKDNEGISKATNQALDRIQNDTGQKYDIIIKIDNDCEIKSPKVLKAIRSIYKANHKMIISPYVQGLIDNPGGGKRIPNLRGRIKGYRTSVAEHIGGIFCATPSKIFEKWRFPEDDFKHGIQDVTFSQYAVSKGYQLHYLDDYFVEHIDTTYVQDEKFPKYKKQRDKAKTERPK